MLRGLLPMTEHGQACAGVVAELDESSSLASNRLDPWHVEKFPFLRLSGSNGSTFERDGLPFVGPLLKVPKFKGEPFVSRSLGQMRKRTGSLLGLINTSASLRFISGGFTGLSDDEQESLPPNCVLVLTVEGVLSIPVWANSK